MFLCVERVFAEAVHSNLPVFFATHAAQYGIDAAHQLFHRERLGYVVVRTYLESLEHIVFQSLCSKEYYGYVGVDIAYLLCKRETVFFRHHHVKHAKVVLAFQERLVASFSVGAEVCVESFCLKELPEKHSQVFVVLTKEYFYFFFHNLLLYYLLYYSCLLSGSPFSASSCTEGRVMMKHVPTPNSLSTLISPPKTLTIFLTYARPRPNPLTSWRLPVGTR